MNHIRDIGEAEWLRYIEQRSLTIHDLLVREYADWHAPDKQYLQLTGWTALTYWQWIHKRATSPQVRANAIAEIRKIETTVLKVCGTKDRVVCVCRFLN